MSLYKRLQFVSESRSYIYWGFFDTELYLFLKGKLRDQSINWSLA
jgi:hypothetical protein